MPMRLQYGFMLAVIFVGAAVTIGHYGLIVGLIIIAIGVLLSAVGARLLVR